MAAQEGVDFADLITDRVMSYLPHELLQRHKAAPQARFLSAHPNLEVTLLVSRASCPRSRWSPGVFCRVCLGNCLRMTRR
jgi:hypothetical protein